MNRYQKNLERSGLVGRLEAALKRNVAADLELAASNKLLSTMSLEKAHLKEQIDSKDKLAQGYRESISRLQDKVTELCLAEIHLRALLISSWK